MPRFYADIQLQVDAEISLPETVFHHWVKVLRAQVGQQAILFNGQGGEYTVSLTDIQKKQAMIKVTGFNPADRVPDYQVTLGQVMSKGDRMDYAIQKATELGVYAIQLLISERCEMRLKYERDQRKLDHWQQIAIAACEQCGMNRIPQIIAPLTLEQWLLQSARSPARKLVLAPARHSIQLNYPFPAQFEVLVGPEGGFSDTEMQHIQTQGFESWTLGQRVFRTETAPVVALSALMWSHNVLLSGQKE